MSSQTVDLGSQAEETACTQQALVMSAQTVKIAFLSGLQGQLPVRSNRNARFSQLTIQDA